MECTLASSMAKLALEEKGLQARTAILEGHQVVMSEDKNSITIYDPSTRYTGSDNVTHTFKQHFAADQITNIENVYGSDKRLMGGKFRVETKDKPGHTGMFDAFDPEKGIYYRDFLRTNINTLVELSVVLHNLDELPNKEKYSSLEGLDAHKLINEAGIFDHEAVFK